MCLTIGFKDTGEVSNSQKFSPASSCILTFSSLAQLRMEAQTGSPLGANSQTPTLSVQSCEDTRAASREIIAKGQKGTQVRRGLGVGTQLREGWQQGSPYQRSLHPTHPTMELEFCAKSNELSLLLGKSHPSYPLAQTRAMISGRLSVKAEKGFLFHANNSVVNDLCRGLWEGEPGSASSSSVAPPPPQPP